MAIALGAALTSLGDTTNASSYVTAAFAPAANNLVIAIISASSATAATTCTLAGGGVTTWTEETSLATPYNTIASPNRKIWVFRAQQASYSASAAATFTLGTSSTGVAYSIFQFSGVENDVAGNGAACIINKVTNASDVGATSGSATLAAATSTGNMPVAAFSHVANEAATERANWTEIHDVTYATPNNALETQWRSDAFETSASATWTTSSVWGAVAFEVVMAQTYDQEQADSTTAASIVGGTNATAAYAQSFVPSISGTIQTVQARVYKISSPTDNLICEIQTDASTKPSGVVVGASPQIACSGLVVDPGVWRSFTVNAPVAAGVKYWLVLRRDIGGAGDSTNRPLWKLVTTNPYAAGGLSALNGSTGVWTAESISQDFAFRIPFGVFRNPPYRQARQAVNRASVF